MLTRSIREGRIYLRSAFHDREGTVTGAPTLVQQFAIGHSICCDVIEAKRGRKLSRLKLQGLDINSQLPPARMYILKVPQSSKTALSAMD